MSNDIHTEDLVIRRLINASVEQVWDAWTKPDQVMKWWGPKDYTAPSAEIDLREGGKWVFCMRAPENQGGQDSYGGGTYQKIVPHERLEFTQGLTDAEGNPLPAGQLPEGFPTQLHTTLEFKKVKDDLTELVITERGWEPSTIMVFAIAGTHQSVDKLIASLS
jgi:uncharacterized protein YndB with AHSA1/START domain